MNDLDLLKLAQLHNAKNLLKERKLDLVKKINVHYSIPSETYRILHQHSYLGYNCLHIAALNLDNDFIQELLNCGADLFKQGTQNHKSPLHVAVDSINEWKDIRIWEISDKLQSCQVVDTLLFAHVTSGNSMNPKCKNGISHLHIACMFNCTELVAFLLKSGESTNQVTNADALWPGYTPLHFAARYSCVEAAQCLIDNGADVVAKDAKGISPLHILIERLLHKINHVSLDRFSFHKHYEVEIKRLQAIISTLIKNRIKSNVLDDTGLTVFHIACTLRDTSIASQLLGDVIDLNKPVAMDSKFWAGWTPLHFAACSSAKMVKLLVQSGGDITVKNERKQTPLDICLKRYCPSDVHSILSTKEEFKSILFSDNSTNLLDLLLTMNSSKSFNSYLDSIENPNICVSFVSPILPRYSLLHLALSLKEKLKFQQNIDFLPQDYNCPRHVFEVFSNKIKACLAKGCSVTTKNFDGLTPIHLAFSSHCSPSTVKELLSKCERDALDPDDLSLLHIACAVGHLPTVKRLILARQTNVNAVADKSFQRYRKSRLDVNIDDPEESHESHTQSRLYAVNANSTPLHVAVTFAHKDVIDFLLDNGADVHAQDAEGLTPIHQSIAADERVERGSTARRIFNNQIGALKDRTSRHGLTHLHVAAYAGHPAAVKKLVLDGANVNCVVGTEVPEFLSYFAGKTPLQLAMQLSPMNKTFEALIELGADTYVDGLIQRQMHMRRGKNSVQKFCDKLKLRENVNEPIEPRGLTLLHVACSNLDVDWAEKLLQKGADVNAQIRDDEDYEGHWKGYTPLHVLAFRSVESIAGVRPLVGLLLKYNADVTIASDWGTVLQMNVFLFDTIKTFVNGDQGSARLAMPFRKILRVNSIDSCGSSYLHLALMTNRCVRRQKTVEKFLDSGVDVNQSECPFFGNGDTALHSVMRRDFSFKMARLLMERGANVNAENSYGNTPLHVAVNKLRLKRNLLDCFKRHGADFNAKNIEGETPVDILMKLEDFSFELLQYFLTNGSSTTLRRSEVMREILMNAARDDLLQLLKIFIRVCNVKDATVKNGYNPIQEVVYNKRGQHDWLDVLQVFVNEDCDVNQRSEDGNTPLHTAISCENDKAVESLLQVGADVKHMREGDTFFPEVGRLIALQVYKMNILSLYVNDTSNKIYEKFKGTWSFDEIEKSCKREIEKAKTFKIMNSLTANAFLSEREAVIQYSKMPPDQRRVADIFFKGLVYLNREFPQLAGLMICQYKKAARSQRIKSARQVLAMECDMDMPDPCLEGILDYFSNNELEYLIENSVKASNMR